MKWIILFCSLFTLPLYGQPTWSQIKDIDPDALRNSPHNFEIIDSHIYVYVTLFCNSGTPWYAPCVAITKWNMSGEIIKTATFDSFNSFDGPGDCLTTNGENLFLSTRLKEALHKYTVVMQLNQDLEQLSLHQYKPHPSNDSFSIDNRGIKYIDGALFIYDRKWGKRGDPDSAQIIKTDLDGNELSRKSYSFYKTSKHELADLQATPDGNLAFVINAKHPPGTIKDFAGFKLMKVDTAWQVLDTFAFERPQYSTFRVTSDGGYVLGSQSNPYDPEDILSGNSGFINKMDANMDTIIWSTRLPNDQLIDGRYYRVSDYIETANGDIVACGEAWDNTDTERNVGLSDKNTTWNGFIVRMSPQGEIIWLRLYKTPNDLLPSDKYGRFRPSGLNNIKELPDGRLVAVGIVYVNGAQRSAINEMETETVHLWMLAVDENGCLDGYNCNEIIRIDHDYVKEYNVGNQWIYEEVYGMGGGKSQIGYESFEIQDTVFDGTHTKCVISDIMGGIDTFYVENDKMYFWDEYFQEYIKYYDWQETASYDIKYYDQFRESEEVATVIIDSITYKHFSNEDSLKVQHLRILNSGTIEDDYEEVVYEGVGASHFGIKFLLGCGLCDWNPFTTRLRCFINDTMTYNFAPYACDSTWLKTNITEIEKENFILYPNPTSNTVTIEGINKDVDYELYDISGQLVEKGITVGKAFDIKRSGVYMVRFKVGNKWVQRKVVNIK